MPHRVATARPVPDLDHLHAFLIDPLSQRKEVAGSPISVVHRHSWTAAVPDLQVPPVSA